MLFELALLSVAIPAGYGGLVYVRRRPFGSATYGYMLLATAFAALAAFLARRAGNGDLDVVGAISLGAGAFLLIVAPMLRSAARWAINAEHLTLATALIDLRDLLQPGTGGREEKVMVQALREVRAGRVDDAVAALRAVRPHAPPPARRQIDERIALLYLSAFRFRDAVDHVEQTLLADAPPDAPPGSPVGLADLPISVGLYAEMVGAYGRLGDLDRAAAIADDIERRAAGAADLVFLIHRVRLVFLAFAGRVGAVDRLLAPTVSSHMTPASRRYWAGVARERAGDRDGARQAYRDAHDRARREPRARDVVARALDSLDAAPAAAVSDDAAAVADRLAAAEIRMPAATRARRPLATWSLVGVNLAVAAAIALILGGAGDVGAIVRAGAVVHSAVAAGETWRLPAATFIHVGLLHLVINVLGLWILGRLAETVFGPARLVAIYLAAGLGGASASYLFGPTGVSAGASGAIFGLLGALLVELVLHRRHYRPAWRRSLVSSLAFAAVAQIAVGSLISIIDNWAHIGGLVSGAVVAAIVSPHMPWPRVSAAVGRVVVAAAAAVVLWGAGRTVTTGFDTTLARYPEVSLSVGGLAVTVPSPWHVEEGAIVDTDIGIVLELRDHDGPQSAQWNAWLSSTGEQLRRDGPVREVPSVVPLPDGWRGIELEVRARDALGTEQRSRALVFARDLESGGSAFGVLHLPEVLAESGAPALARIIASIRPQR